MDNVAFQRHPALPTHPDLCSLSWILDSFQPSRNSTPKFLTQPSKGVYNHGYDNEHHDYIILVDEILDAGYAQYVVLEFLGSGTFGQVVKCRDIATDEIVAVKIIKNLPSYFKQSLVEVSILDILDKYPQASKSFVQMKGHFVHQHHLCIVFELLGMNLFELIKHNRFQGFSHILIKTFISQILDGLDILEHTGIVHCDLKPENILLKSMDNPELRIIDFGSACQVHNNVHTYLQSRFYRAPEIILGLPYTSAIDIWSLGCILAELFLGLPLFPGSSNYDQLSRMLDVLGYPSTSVLRQGTKTSLYFNLDQKKYTLKSRNQFNRENNTFEQPSKQYLNFSKLDDIIYHRHCSGLKTDHAEIHTRAVLLDFLRKLLTIDPHQRLTAKEARHHPYLRGYS